MFQTQASNVKDFFNMEKKQRWIFTFSF